MPPVPPAGLSAWEREEHRLWLGSIGWYGRTQVRYYHALLLAHRASRPAPEAPSLPPAPAGVVIDASGMRTLDGWPEWSPGVFGPVPISVVEAVQRGEMYRDPVTGFYELTPRQALIDEWYASDPDQLDVAESTLPMLDDFLGALLPEPSRSLWRRMYGDFQEGRLPLESARAFLGALLRVQKRVRVLARRAAPTVRRASRPVRPKSSPTSSASERTIEYISGLQRSTVTPEIIPGASAVERAAARLLGATSVGAAAPTGVMASLAASRAAVGRK